VELFNETLETLPPLPRLGLSRQEDMEFSDIPGALVLPVVSSSGVQWDGKGMEENTAA